MKNKEELQKEKEESKKVEEELRSALERIVYLESLIGNFTCLNQPYNKK